MSAKPKQTSRWGSLLQGAVAGLESRLDTILADSESSTVAGGTGGEQTTALGRSTTSTFGTAKAAEQDLSRSSSRGRADGRLQDRLAKAMGNADAKRASSRPSTDTPPRTNSPAIPPDTSTKEAASKSSSALLTEATAQQSESTSQNKGDGDEISEVDGLSRSKESESNPLTKQTLSVPLVPSEAASSRTSQDSMQLRPSIDEPPSVLAESSEFLSNISRSPNDDELEELRQAHVQELKQRQEEMHEHLERIDALQAKLQYLTKAAIESAKERATEAAPGSLERKLAEKDEQIGLLMEEGQKLSKNELKHLNTIKKLRNKHAEEGKSVTEMKHKLAKTERALAEAEERYRRAEVTEKQAEERMKQLGQIEKEVGALQSEREASALMISELRRQLDMASRRAEEAENKVQKDAHGAESRLIDELKEQLSDAGIEKKLAEDRLRAELRDVKQEAARQQDKASALESELRNEITGLETKLEILRSRTEEVSSSATSDSQAKLLRQIETLQTQYALASENWQGIEGTLTARLAALERERDEVAKREADIRKKARELSLKARRLEEELEAANDKMQAQEQDFNEQRAQIQRLQTRLEQAESALTEAKADFARNLKLREIEFQQRLEEEKSQWRAEPSPQFADPNFLRADSPTTSHRKHSATEALALSSRRSISRTISHDLSVSTADRSSGRIPAQAQRTPDSGTPQRQDSLPSLPHLNGFSHPALPPSHSPSIHTAEPEESFDHSSSPHRTIADMVSASTVGAGPSVQLVERMSAAVRRLESEKAASKEELARLVAQRDEARQEVVALMSEVEEKREADAKIAKLEKELKEMDERYQTTLEMLGEKSERVDELMNDVADLKEIYRELVESKTR